MSKIDKHKQSIVTLYDDILRLVEEEIYQRQNGKTFQDITSSNAQTGGGCGNFQTGGTIPGKFDIIKHSMSVPIDVAIRGTIARQQLFIQERAISNTNTNSNANTNRK